MFKRASRQYTARRVCRRCVG